MKKLKLGKITLDELADWFGISSSTIRNSKTKSAKLKILQTYADYHIEKRSIYIDKIYIEEFNKAYSVIKTQLPQEWSANGLDTCSRVGTRIYNKHKEIQGQIKYDTALNYTRRAKNELYGRNYVDSDYGELGRSEFAWAKYNMEQQSFEALTDKEKQIIRECSYEVYGKKNAEKQAILSNAYYDNKISYEEYQGNTSLTANELIDCNIRFMSLVSERMGFIPARVTRIWTTNDYELYGECQREKVEKLKRKTDNDEKIQKILDDGE